MEDDVMTKTWLDLSDRLPKSVLSAVHNIDDSSDKQTTRINYTPGGQTVQLQSSNGREKL